MASAHQGWYGAQQPPPPPPPQGFAYRAPYYTGYGAPVERRSSRRSCGYAQSIVRQFSLVVPVILVIVTAYVYGRDAHFRGGRPGAGDPVWVPLYLTIPISAANIFWNLAMMINRRRSAHRGRALPLEMQFLTELILTVGAVVCLILMVVVLYDRESDSGWLGGGYFPFAYHQSMAWLLGIQMLASGFLCGCAGAELWRRRRHQPQMEAYTIH